MRETMAGGWVVEVFGYWLGGYITSKTSLLLMRICDVNAAIWVCVCLSE